MKKIIPVLFALVFSLFLNVIDVMANEIPNEIKNNFPKEVKINNPETNNNAKTDISKASDEDIFGDEQAFPFIAGLGKNAAH